MMLYVDYHIWDSFQVDSLVKGLWIPRLPLDFRFCHQLWTAITFSKIISFQKFWVFWKATDLNRSFLPKTSLRDKIKVSLGTHAFGEFRKFHDLEACTTPPMGKVNQMNKITKKSRIFKNFQLWWARSRRKINIFSWYIF